MLAPGEQYHDLVTLVRTKAQKNSPRIALRFADASLTYRELDEHSDRAAAGLSEAGFGPGDRVASLLSNRAEFPILWFALAKLGAILVPLNTALRGDLLQYRADRLRSERGRRRSCVPRRFPRSALVIVFDHSMDRRGALPSNAIRGLAVS